MRFHLRDGGADGFDELTEWMVSQVAIYERGSTLVYTAHTLAAEPTQRIFYELYAGLEAFQRHEDAAHTKRFKTERERFVERHEVDFLTPINGLDGP